MYELVTGAAVFLVVAAFLVDFSHLHLQISRALVFASICIRVVW